MQALQRGQTRTAGRIKVSGPQERDSTTDRRLPGPGGGPNQRAEARAGPASGSGSAISEAKAARGTGRWQQGGPVAWQSLQTGEALREILDQILNMLQAGMEACCRACRKPISLLSAKARRDRKYDAFETAP